MKRIYLLSLISLLFLSFCSENETVKNGEPDYISIDAVYSFTVGENGGAGSSEEYFPDNIFGAPSSEASEYVPETSADEILCFGLGGELVVGFKDYWIVDGDGADFVVFENAFVNSATDKVFCEPARVSIYNAGGFFVDFPFDSLSLSGCAGITPTYGKAKNLLQMGGDEFDLKDLGVYKTDRIKITDISRMLLENPAHPYYDATISGFDLDAVIAINYEMK